MAFSTNKRLWYITCYVVVILVSLSSNGFINPITSLTAPSSSSTLMKASFMNAPYKPFGRQPVIDSLTSNIRQSGMGKSLVPLEPQPAQV